MTSAETESSDINYARRGNRGRFLAFGLLKREENVSGLLDHERLAMLQQLPVRTPHITSIGTVNLSIW
jgi:hypothetical protein